MQIQIIRTIRDSSAFALSGRFFGKERRSNQREQNALENGLLLQPTLEWNTEKSAKSRIRYLGVPKWKCNYRWLHFHVLILRDLSSRFTEHCFDVSWWTSKWAIWDFPGIRVLFIWVYNVVPKMLSYLVLCLGVISRKWWSPQVILLEWCQTLENVLELSCLFTLFLC